ncbi:hypothetical protein ACFLRM_05815 [Acidobacteriota bacterium]
MKCCRFLSLSFMILYLPLFSANLNQSIPPELAKQQPQSKEVFLYEAYPVSGESSAKKKTVEMTLDHYREEKIFSMKTHSVKKIETVMIFTQSGGEFSSGEKTVADSSGKTLFLSNMKKKDQEVVVKAQKKKAWKIKKYVIPEGKELAVDGSLLVMLRSFPFEKGIKWELFMVAFSQKSVMVSVEEAGTELVSVPAGEFECYRMEVTIKIPIFRIKIIYWLTKKKPHFLVQHRGLTGPVLGRYLTKLVRFQL